MRGARKGHGRGLRDQSPAREPAREVTVLYQHPSYPGQLIARERQWLVAWPAEPGGWQRRVPTAVDLVKSALVEVPLSTAYGTGWHRARRPVRGPVPVAGVSRTERRVVALTPDECAAHDKARGDKPWSEWAREAFALALTSASSEPTPTTDLGTTASS